MTEETGFLARICDIRVEAEGVKSFLIERADGEAFPHWSPGAHVDLALGAGMNRQYSLCASDPDGGRARFAVLREFAGRGGSALLHDQAKAGDEIAITACRNNFPLVEAERYRLIAGGIGITPIIAMARQLEAWGKEWRLLYGGRTRAGMAFLEELTAYGDKVAIRPADEFGLLDIADFLDGDEVGKAAYCCGPEPLIAAVERHCATWPEEALQIERFHPRAAEGPAASGSFEVELSRSGGVVTVPPDRSIAEVLEDFGVHIPRSCNEGTCGTCVTKVIAGIPDHRDSFLRPRQRAENKRIMPCCSRALSTRLVLDV